MRKDLKAPDWYPKKQSLQHLHVQWKSPTLGSECTDLDINHNEQVVVCARDHLVLPNKDAAPSTIKLPFDPVLSRFIPSTDTCVVVGPHGLVETWDMTQKTRLSSKQVSKSEITDLTFQPTNDYCAFALHNSAWSFYDLTVHRVLS